MIGIVADDITGAGDIGIMYAKAGHETHIYAYCDELPELLADMELHSRRPDVLIVDTNSRLDAPEVAARKVRNVTQLLSQLGCSSFYNKTCSVFRGNIGAEFDAMLGELGRSFAVVVLGFPKNGRQTIGGVHYVRGVPLAETEFRKDPVHPMRESDLVNILQSQTNGVVTPIDIKIVDQGATALREAIHRLRNTCRYAIVDVRDQTSLQTIAEAVQDEPVVCGSSGIAEELAKLHKRIEKPVAAGKGTLIAAGSLMPQTSEQIRYVQERGMKCVKLDTLRVLDGASRASYLPAIIAELVRTIEGGEDVLLYTARSEQEVAETKQSGMSCGMTETEVSRVVSEAIAQAAGTVIRDSGARQFIIAGGETSAAVCRSLAINGMKVIGEIEPGLPSCMSLTHPERLFVLKSGSFGSPDFFAKALEHMKTVPGCHE